MNTFKRETGKVEPRWVLVEGELRSVPEFAHLPSRQRPPAICPLCERPVVLKLGAVKVHHYAHAREASCAASVSETALHLNAKFHLQAWPRHSGHIWGGAPTHFLAL